MAKKILVVDDEGMIVKLLSIRLESLGYKIVSAFDGVEGLEMAKSEQPDLLILDLGLPRMDGNTLCEIIKTDPSTKHMKVIMLTGNKLVGDMEKSFSAGADAYINKPYDWQRLAAHIHELLGEPK
ncbi:MAG: hypothetical protein A3J79_09420 [Elusimicrobia bacterium RIFOXYB2_FULL_62_6]|nr:MAG: hypothetical protein A3J79_09420 [Elusimicrobia bacterium RIFOXYB2_FULL_62_6]